jgi:hypothetical protein
MKTVPVTAAAVVTQNAAAYFIPTVSLFGSLVACKRCHSMPSEYSVDADARSKSRSRACNNGKKRRLRMFCHSLKGVLAGTKDAPRERRDVSRMLQVQARARQQRGCIHSPVGIPSLSNPTRRAKTSAPELRVRALNSVPCSGPTDLRHAR